jgi:hypothetical protein
MRKLLHGIKMLLQGGYCLKSLAEGVALTLHSLLDDLCPQLGPLLPPMDRYLYFEHVKNCSLWRFALLVEGYSRFATNLIILFAYRCVGSAV